MAKKADGTIRIDVKALTKSYESALKKAGSISFAFGALLADVMQKAAKEIAELVPEVQDLRNEISDLETKTGIAAATLSGLRNAARGSGQQFTELQSALSQFPKRLADVARGTGEAKVAFDKLDIGATNADGSLRSADDVLKEFVAKVKQVKDPTSRAALATSAFGEAGGKLLQALGGGELEAHIEFARRYGTDVGPDAAKAADDWQRASAELSTMMDGVKGSIVDLMGPTEKLEGFMVGAVAIWAEFTYALDLAALAVTNSIRHMKALGAAVQGNFELASFYQQRIIDTTAAIKPFGQTAREAADELIALQRAMRGTGKRADKTTIQFGDLKDEVIDLSKEMADFIKLNEEYAAETDALYRATLSQEEQLELATLDRAFASIKAGEEAGREAEAKLAANLIMQQGEDELLSMQRARAASMKELYQEAADFQILQIDRAREKQQEADDARVSAQQAQLSATMGLTSMLSSVFAESAAQQAKLGEAGKKRAMAQFAISKSLAIGQAIMNTAQGVTSAMAMYPPNLVLAGIVGAAGAVQVGTIASQTPSFHIGTRAARGEAPDERTATITKSEVVLTPQGAASANAGITPAQPAQRWVLQLGTDAFDAQVRMAENTGGRFSRAAAGRSRIGHRVSK
jgi:hypothetical protein